MTSAVTPNTEGRDFFFSSLAAPPHQSCKGSRAVGRKERVINQLCLHHIYPNFSTSLQYKALLPFSPALGRDNKEPTVPTTQDFIHTEAPNCHLLSSNLRGWGLPLILSATRGNRSGSLHLLGCPATLLLSQVFGCQPKEQEANLPACAFLQQSRMNFRKRRG